MDTEDSPFKDLIHCQYGVELPYLFEGSFSDAKKHAQSFSKYLIICLHAQCHEDADFFFKNTLLHSEIVAQFLERCVFFGACVEDLVGVKLATQYNVRVFPSLVVLFKNEIALELGGPLTAERVLGEWRKCTDVWDTEVAEDMAFQADQRQRQASLEEESRQMEMLEREDIERLKRFEEEQKEKKRLQEERRQQKLAAEREREAQEREERERREREAQQAEERAKAARLLDPEPDASDQTFTVRLRFPKGETYTRRFRWSDKADQLMYYVLSLDLYQTFSRLEFVCGYPPAPLEWDSSSVFSDLKRISTNIVINVRVIS